MTNLAKSPALILLIIWTCAYVQVTISAPTRAPPCGGNPADVLFLLDASGSIWEGHFDQQLDFVGDVIQTFDVSPANTRVGVYTFGTVVREDVPLAHYTSRDALLHNVTAITQLSRGTMTHRALRAALHTFQQRGRQNTRHIVIVLTDGRSEDPKQTEEMAKELHQTNIVIFVVGIGPKANTKELFMMASKPQHVFEVDSFAALQTIKDNLAIKACKVEQPDILTFDSTSVHTRYCNGKPADIVFVLDASGSIYHEDFQKQLTFVKNVTAIFDIAPNATRVGVMTFGDEPRDQVALGGFSTTRGVQHEVGQITQQKGETFTDIALQHMVRQQFGRHPRPNVVKIGVIITDGRSNDPSATQRQAEEARKSGVHLLAVGVGSKADQAELNAIASKSPGKGSYVFHVENYSALESIKELLAFKACQVSAQEGSGPVVVVDPPCKKDAPADVVLILPASSSASQMTFVVSWIQDLIQNLGEEDRLGIVPRVCPSLAGFQLRDYSTKEDILAKLHLIQSPTSGTASMIKHMRKKSFVHNSQSGRKKIGVVFLDEESTSQEDVAAEAMLAKRESSLELFVVSIGKHVSEAEKRAIATIPHTQHILDVPDYESLTDSTSWLLHRISHACQSG